MMFALRRLLMLGIILLAGYCVWPRTASLTAFKPARIAELQITVWKNAQARQRWELGTSLYKLYVGQYGISPLTALKMAIETSDAMIRFQSAPDAADQEKALVPLDAAFATFQNRLQAPFDSHAAAMMEFQIWSLRANGNRQADLTKAVDEQLALLYGKSSGDCIPAAQKFVVAMAEADAGRWAMARAASKEAWETLQGTLKQP